MFNNRITILLGMSKQIAHLTNNNNKNKNKNNQHHLLLKEEYKKKNRKRKTSKLIKNEEEQQVVTKEYKYKIGFNQSVSTGVVALEGYVHFDDDQAMTSTEYLIVALQRFKDRLKDEGYTLATDAAPKRIKE